MAAATVILPDTTPLALDSHYGHELVIEEEGAYKATVVLSPINQRIQVLAYQAPRPEAFAAELERLAKLNNYGKVWIKARRSEETQLVGAGFEVEARIPGFF